MGALMLLRPAVPADALDVARVHVRAWQSAYRGLLPDNYLEALRPEDRARRYDFRGVDPLKPYTVVAVEAESIVGFATTAPARDSDCLDAGELAALYVDPDLQGRGIGRGLIENACARLRGQGFAKAILWLLAGNSAAERFYRARGWTPDGHRRTAAVWGVTVDEIRFASDLATRGGNEPGPAPAGSPHSP